MVRRLLVILLQALTGLLVILALWIVSHLAGDRPPPGPVVCAANGTSGCTLTNIYGSFSDRAICRAANVTYPRTEVELVAAVAAAVAAGRKVKVATRYSNSFPRLACPGGEDGTVISTRWLDRAVRVDAARRLMTVESGMVMRDLIREAAAAGLALPHSPYWSGLTIGGVLATGAHGSSLWGKGSAVHEYVVGMRIVTPAPASEGFAAVRELAAGDPDLDAAKVSLGVLGAISQVTLALQPLFKRSVAFVTRNDSDVADTVAAWGRLHEFGDVAWLPRRRVAVYRVDDRVDVATPGDGRSDYPAFRPTPTIPLVASRLAEEWLEERSGSDAARCAASRVMPATLEHLNYGLTNDGEAFTGYPVVGYQHRIQASSSCTGAMEDDGLIPTSTCLWNGRLRGHLFYNSGFSIALSRARAFVADVARLRDLNPAAFCQIDSKMGLLMRYVAASSAYLGKAEDSVDFDVTYYRSYARGAPRAHADVFDEVEQMALRKHGGVPHWGKNRNYAFDGAIARYPNAGEFMRVKDRFDPDGVFSSEWSDQVLGVGGASPVIVGDGCAMEGLCVCSDDSHCAPEKGYFCRPGKVFTAARVCSPSPRDAANGGDDDDEISDVGDE
ncbi:L-gulonolactone oxidase 2-like [Oryza glaberrima]|uniref:L-gulonolactone oxidase n=1 Tax=Oryza glaberrima TaxID=4538 RepID=I1P663_ORYGL|nr:L-gulonolactone oxidase 2-like [Oryza glaberrima]